MHPLPILALCLLAALACAFICLADVLSPGDTEYGGSRVVATYLDAGN